MKKFNQLVLSLLLIAGSTAAHAAVYSFTDVVDPSPDELIAFGVDKSYSYSHSILDDGYDALTDTITGATLVFSFSDESADAAAESVSFTFDLTPFGSETITSGGGTYISEFTGLTLSGLIAPDGILNIVLENAGTTSGHQANRSDFLFLGSTLTVNVERAGTVALPAAVSEPGPLALFGAGFLGLGWVARRRRAR